MNSGDIGVKDALESAGAASFCPSHTGCCQVYSSIIGVADCISVAGTAQQHHASVVLCSTIHGAVPSVVLRGTKPLLLLQFAIDLLTQ